jgi:AcrR family transcriptional regulator
LPGAAKDRTYHHGDLRRALLVAAEAELAEKGVEGFTLRGCAKRAGVSHAAPAHHFKDAAALLTALAAEGFRRFIAAMERRMETGTTARGRLIGCGLGYLDFARGNPALFGLMFSSKRPDYDDPALGEVAHRSFQVLTQAVRAVRGADPLVDKAAMLDAVTVWSVVHGLAQLLLAGQLHVAVGENPDPTYAEIIGRALPEATRTSRK